ncbi:MAG: ABC transporter ATP-binding protein/permease [Deltaproteobacteria bacterium]|nr:ABC transporter ATP-binding protein/permease [Deltaproteobacteria bacterium]
MKSHSSIRVAISYLKKQKLLLGSALFWRSIHELAPMQVPIFTGIVIDGLTNEKVSMYGLNWSPESSLIVLQIAAIGLLVVALLRGSSAYAWTYSSAKLSRNFVTELRKKLIEKITFLSLDVHHQYGPGDLLDRTLRDTATTRAFMERVFVQTFTSFLRMGYPILMLILIDPILTGIALSVIPPQQLISRYLEKKLHVATQKSRESDSDLMSAVKENLDGIETIQTLNSEITSIDRLGGKTDRLEVDQLHANRVTALLRGTVWLLTGIGFALTWWRGGLLVIDKEMTIGTLVVFTGFVKYAYRPFRLFTGIVKAYRRGLVSLERIHDVLDTPSSIREKQNAHPISISKGRMELRNVSFAYGSQPVLKDINLTLEPHSLIAIVGGSGSGKSSLLRLIVRLYDPSRGSVLIDDQAIDEVTLKSLRSQMSVVPQSPILFSGTVYENICLAKPDASRQEVKEACRFSSAQEFIERLEDGLDTYLGPGGTSLSGGEAQRITIARALLNLPKIMLMDEPTSSLDADSEAILLQSLLELKKNMTIVVASHRLETIRHADKIVVMEHGRVILEGTHSALLERSEVYRELFSNGRFTA